MRGFDAFGLTENIEEGVEGVKGLVAIVVVHGEEEFDGAVGFSVSGVTFGEDGEGFGSWAEAEGAHAAQ